MDYLTQSSLTCMNRILKELVKNKVVDEDDVMSLSEWLFLSVPSVFVLFLLKENLRVRQLKMQMNKYDNESGLAGEDLFVGCN